MAKKEDQLNRFRKTIVDDKTKILEEKQKLEDRFAGADAVLEKDPNGFSDEKPAAIASPSPAVADAGIADVIPRPATVISAMSPGVESGLTPEIPYGDLAQRWLGTPRYEEWPIEKIRDNPYNARHIYLPQKVAALAASMRQSGQLVPGMAVADGEFRILVAAHYRKRAAKAAGLSTLKVMTYDKLSNKDLYELSYKENTEQSPQSVIDNALSWRKLLDDGVYKHEEELAEAIGMSRPNIFKTLSILKLEQSVRSYVDQQPEAFGLTVLYELVLLQQAAGSGVAEDMASRVLETGIGRKEIAAARDRHNEKAGAQSTKRVNETARSYKLWNASDVNVGNIKEWDSGKVAVEVNFGDAADQQAFINEMRARFGAKADPNPST